jgi:hypothetical protein
VSWLKAINGFIQIINTLFEMAKEKKYRQMGYKKAKEEVEKSRQQSRKVADEIDSSPDVNDPWNGL